MLFWWGDVKYTWEIMWYWYLIWIFCLIWVHSVLRFVVTPSTFEQTEYLWCLMKSMYLGKGFWHNLICHGHMRPMLLFLPPSNFSSTSFQFQASRGVKLCYSYCPVLMYIVSTDPSVSATSNNSHSCASDSSQFHVTQAVFNLCQLRIILLNVLC